MDNVIIIGAGPAGVSASLYTLRAGIKTALIHTGESALGKAHSVENYYGFSAPVSGVDLLNAGLANAVRLGAETVNAEVVAVEEEKNGFTVRTASEAYTAAVVILASGASRAKLKWRGFDEYEGKGISYCAVCDGFFFRGKDVAVAGSGPYALHEAIILLPIAKSVTVCTDGDPLTAEFPSSVNIIEKPVDGLGGGDSLSHINFTDGSKLDTSALFVAIGTAGSTDLAKKMGAVTNANNIAVDENMRTNIPGLLAAGDCTGGMKQIAKAVYEGAAAGTEAVKIIRKK